MKSLKYRVLTLKAQKMALNLNDYRKIEKITNEPTLQKSAVETAAHSPINTSDSWAEVNQGKFASPNKDR